MPVGEGTFRGVKKISIKKIVHQSPELDLLNVCTRKKHYGEY